MSSQSNVDILPVLSWKIEYATTGRSVCNASRSKIPEGSVRIGAEIDKPYDHGSTMIVWYLPENLISGNFERGSMHKNMLTSTGQLAGFDNLSEVDKRAIMNLIIESRTDVDDIHRNGPMTPERETAICARVEHQEAPVVLLFRFFGKPINLIFKCCLTFVSIVDFQ